MRIILHHRHPKAFNRILHNLHMLITVDKVQHLLKAASLQRSSRGSLRSTPARSQTPSSHKETKMAPWNGDHSDSLCDHPKYTMIEL